MFDIKKIEDNFAACCCSHYVAASIAMFFMIMTSQCFVKGFKTEENSKLKNTEINSRLLDLETG